MEQPNSVGPQPSYLLLTGPRPSTNSSQPRLTVQHYLGIFKPSKGRSHLRLLYTSCRVTPGKTQVGTDLACTTQETPEPVHPVDTYRPGQSTTTLPLHNWSFVEAEAGGQWTQPALAADSLGKSLPLTCQHQSRFNYKKRVYSAHMKGTHQVPSLGDRGDCATGP